MEVLLARHPDWWLVFLACGDQVGHSLLGGSWPWSGRVLTTWRPGLIGTGADTARSGGASHMASSGRPGGTVWGAGLGPRGRMVLTRPAEEATVLLTAGGVGLGRWHGLA